MRFELISTFAADFLASAHRECKEDSALFCSLALQANLFARLAVREPVTYY